jgi:predicted dehydrogenase/glycosyltransferase involved in cell wall biosynthesis
MSAARLRPRLCLATDSLAPSGMGEHMLTLATGLRDQYDIVIATPADSGLLARAAGLGFAIKPIDPNGHDSLVRFLRTGQFDTVHVHAGIGWEGHGLTDAARAAGIPTVLRTEHLPYLLTDPAQQAEYARAVAAVDRVICVSEHVAQTLREASITPSLLAVVRNGVPASAPSRERNATRALLGIGDAPTLLMVARFTEQKRHAMLLEILPGILRQHPNATVLMAGSGPLLDDVAHAIARLGLAASVRLLGERHDIADLMHAADLLVMPSRFEGLPLVLLEAMAAGLPAVASHAEGIAEAIEHGATGWLAPLDDFDGFAALILHALSDPQARSRIGTASRDRYRQDYQASRMTNQTSALYREAAGERPRARISGDSVNRTRIGFIGAGGIAHRHFGVLEHFDDVLVVAVCDIDPARASEGAARFGARPFSDAEAMLDQMDLDAVYICVPPFAHGAPERAALARNLPFFVEKPVALDLDTAEAIGAAVERQNLITAVGYHWRYLDNLDEVRDLLARNPARMMSGYWLDSTPPPQWWWKMNRSGGQMIEQTTHLLDLSRMLSGEVVRAYGLMGHTERLDFPGLDVPTVSTASLLFANGAIANFASTCLLRWNHRVGLHIFADGLAIELTDRDVMIDVGRGRPVRGIGSDPVMAEDRDFIDAVRGGPNRIRCPYAEALKTHRLAHAVMESAATGKAVEMASARQMAHV